MQRSTTRLRKALVPFALLALTGSLAACGGDSGSGSAAPSGGPNSCSVRPIAVTKSDWSPTCKTEGQELWKLPVGIFASSAAISTCLQ